MIILNKNKLNLFGIYKILNLINNKVYIGSTINNFNHRLNLHISQLRNNKHHSSHLQNAWNKYGEDNFEFSILEVCNNSENILEREQYWIDFYNSFNIDNGYNICINAGNSSGYKFSEEQKERVKKGHEILKGENNPAKRPEVREKISISKKKYYTTPKGLLEREKISNRYKGENNPMFGKISKMKGKKRPEISGKNSKLSIPIIQIDIKTNIILNTYDSISEAEKLLNITHISDCCKNKRKTAGNYKWDYLINSFKYIKET